MRGCCASAAALSPVVDRLRHVLGPLERIVDLGEQVDERACGR